MNLENFKSYISGRPFVVQSYEDEELTKVLNFTELLFSIFYNIPEELLNNDIYEKAVYEESIYLLQNDPTVNFLTKYEGLSQFTIAGTISATVAQEFLSFLSPLAKMLLEKLGLYPLMNDQSSVNYFYSIF